MYLGSDDLDGTYQALKEIINNATDEAIAGFGNKIEICVNEVTNTVSIRDYGRGVPFGIRPDGENVLVSIYTKSHTGGKFNDNVYKNVSGLNGIGGSCVCLSSSWFEVASFRDNKSAIARFDNGVLREYLERPTKEPNGTYVQFTPSPEVFKNGDIGYSFNKICEDIRNISYLYTGLTFEISDVINQTKKTYCAKNGIKDFIKEHLPQPLHNHIIYNQVIDTNGDKLEIAFQWGSKREESYVFVNGLLCNEGGSPITGAKTAITRTFNSLSHEDFNGDAIRGNLFYVINCSVSQPSFANQTKSKINNANLRTLASNCFSEALKDMERNYKDEFNTIVELLKKISRAEAAAERARKQVLEASKDIERNQKRKVFASDKLKDAEYLGQESVLLICEGDSAMGGMSLARDSKRFGLLAVRGKMINCLSNEDEDIFQNEEIKLLLSALNITPGKYDSKKLRYGKLGICSDSDSDGYHIGLLIMAAMTYLAPDFIKEGRLCWLRSPLYIVESGKKRSYYFNDAEFNAAKTQGKVKGEVHRAKGLGALEPDEAHESMFTPEYQRLDILMPDEKSFSLLHDLMGKNVTPRTEFIFKNIDFSEIRE